MKIHKIHGNTKNTGRMHGKYTGNIRRIHGKYMRYTIEIHRKYTANEEKYTKNTREPHKNMRIHRKDLGYTMVIHRKYTGNTCLFVLIIHLTPSILRLQLWEINQQYIKTGVFPCFSGVCVDLVYTLSLSNV